MTWIVSFLTIFLLSCIIHNHLLLTAQGSSNNNQSLNRLSLPEPGTRFEAVEAIFSLPSIDCLGCEFRGIVEKLSETQYSINGGVVAADSISTVIPVSVSVSGMMNISGTTINGTLSISGEKYKIEGTSTTYSPTCSYCKQTLNIRGQSVQGNDVLTANIPLSSIK